MNFFSATKKKTFPKYLSELQPQNAPPSTCVCFLSCTITVNNSRFVYCHHDGREKKIKRKVIQTTPTVD